MTRLPLFERQRVTEKNCAQQRAWKARQKKPENMITCAVPGCGIKRAKAAVIWGNGRGYSCLPACSATCFERLRQMGLA